MKFKALFPLFFTLAAQSAQRDLIQEFLKSHLQLKINKLEKTQSIIDYKILKAQKTWGLSSSFTQKQESSPDEKSRMGNVNVDKSFSWGAGLSLGHSFTRKEGSGAFPIGENSLESNSITYSQDLGRNFFGQKFYTDLQKARAKINLSEIKLSNKNQNELKIFYENLLSTRLKKTLLALEEKALGRSLKRLGITRKRFKDGLSERAELYSAQIEYVKKQQDLETAKFSLEKDLSLLSQMLQRKVGAKEIEKVSLETKIFSQNLNYDIEENLDFKSLTGQLKQLRLELVNLRRNFIPSINLGITYSNTNGREESSNNDDESKDKEYIGLLTLSTPLSWEEERLKKAYKKVEINSLKIRKRQLFHRLKSLQETFQKDLETRRKNLKLSRRRIELSEKGLKENTRLYSIGRSDFDGLLRAEENLISTERILCQ